MTQEPDMTTTPLREKIAACIPGRSTDEVYPVADAILALLTTPDTEGLIERLEDNRPGHWSTAGGLEMALSYASKGRTQLGMADRSDLDLANALYLANGDLPIQTAAKERMRWLSVQLALANEALRASAAREADLQAKLTAVEGERQAALDAANRQLGHARAAQAENARLREALGKIERWELPETGRFWPESGEPMSYGALWGSDGERDFMRGIARAALTAHQEGESANG